MSDTFRDGNKKPNYKKTNIIRVIIYFSVLVVIQAIFLFYVVSLEIYRDVILTLALGLILAVVLPILLIFPIFWFRVNKS